MVKNKFSFPDHNQNFWQLASIQGASQGWFAISMASLLAHQHGSLVAIISILVGNLLVWVVGLGVVSLSAQYRQNVMQVAYQHLGKVGGILTILIVMTVMIFWYTIQIKNTVTILKPLFPVEWNPNVLGILLGIVVAGLSMGGIHLIRRTCVIAFPFMLLFLSYLLFMRGEFRLYGNWEVSFSAVIAVLTGYLPGTVNLGIFFRHSRSRADSMLGLTLTVLSYVFFELCGVFLPACHITTIFGELVPVSSSLFFVLMTILFSLSLFICLNLVNIYFASAGLEFVVKPKSMAKGYFFLGIVGTALYLPLQFSWLQAGERLLQNCIVNLGIVLIISFFIQHLITRRTLRWERLINCGCWLVGCSVTSVFQSLYLKDVEAGFLSGIWAVLFSFILVLFIEQLTWGISSVRLQE